jgi:hypothetical protein
MLPPPFSFARFVLYRWDYCFDQHLDSLKKKHNHEYKWLDRAVINHGTFSFFDTFVFNKCFGILLKTWMMTRESLKSSLLPSDLVFS